jgi:hypothetical protein
MRLRAHVWKADEHNGAYDGRILAITNREETAAAVLRVAQQIAARTDSSKVTVLMPRLPEDPSFIPTEEVMTDERRRTFNHESGRKAASLRLIFNIWQESKPDVKEARLLEIIGDANKSVGGETSHTDPIVIGHIQKDDPEDVRAAFRTALFEADVSVIVAPAQRPSTSGAHPVIAWEKTEAVEEAIGAALPLLSKAERVTIIDANEGCSRIVEMPPGLLDFLKSANVRNDVQTFDLRGRSIGEALLAKAKPCGADPLIMSAYTHNAFLERVIGGATAELLSAADLQLFMHH